MKTLSHFMRATLVGGALFLLPIVALSLFLGKALEFVRGAVKPVIELVPDRFVSTATMSTATAIVLLALVCFLAGLLARTLFAQRAMTHFETSVLSKVPAYKHMKQASASVLGIGEMAEHPVVLAQLGGAWRLGVQTDAAQSGLAAVFVPNSPNAFSGSVFFVTTDRVRPVSVPVSSALGCLRRCGKGGALLFSETHSDESNPTMNESRREEPIATRGRGRFS